VSGTAPRVLQVVLTLNPGGTERLVLELVKRLNAEIPMMVCCLDEGGAWARELEASGVPWRALNRRPGFRLLLGQAVAAAAREHGATVIHAHHYSPFVYGRLARIWRPSLQVVLTEHGRLSDTRPSSKRRMANSILALGQRRIFAVSEDLKRHLAAEGFSPDRIGVIYNGIDVRALPDSAARARAREALAVSDDTFVIGTIARLDPVKNLNTLIQAAGLAAQRRAVRLVIVGDGPEREPLERLARDHGAARVDFLGHRDDARQWLAGCDAYANSSISEGVSLTILEAMAAGLAVVATRVGGTPEVVNASCGRLVDPRNAAMMAEALVELAERADVRGALGRAARQRVETHFTLDRMVREYRDVYRGAA
jgi:glycosyltransferase involved in cell wall biosynthesis